MDNMGFAGFDVGGGAWKKKPFLHDIDLVVREKDWLQVRQAVQARKPPVPVELYIADERNYPGLLRVIRASTYECINGRLMSGLRFRKEKI